MEYSQFCTYFQSALQQNKLPALAEERLNMFYRFAVHLLEVNQITNLTAIRTMPEVITKHFVDSLLASPYIPNGARVLDLGCGAGFPSLPLAIARDDLQIIGLDSTAKKIAFVNQTAVLLRLSNLSGVSGRAEDASLRKKLGMFDIVTSRAVARLNVLNELCLPYVTIGGKLLALKAAKADEELEEAREGIHILGGSPPIPHYLQLYTPTNAEAQAEPRCIIEIAKQKNTPPAYPRAYAAIQKKPL